MYSTASLATEIPAGPVPEWVHLLPLGAFSGRDGRGPWKVATTAVAQQVVAASLAYAGTTKPVIDYDHQSDKAVPQGGTARAAGWIDRLEVRPNGIWGKVEWTAAARTAIGAREYRYISPVFHFDESGNIMRILRAALTNTPALNLTALASVGAHMPEFLKKLAALLGLPDGATEDDVLAAFAGALGRKATPANDAAASAAAVPDPALYVPRALYDGVASELCSVRTAMGAEQASAKVDAAIRGGHLTPAQREWGIALCSQNPASFDAFVASSPAPFAALFARQIPAGAPPRGKGGRAGTLSVEQTAICATLGHSPEDYAKNLDLEG